MEGNFLIRKKKLYEEVIEKIISLIQTDGYKVGDRLPSLQELSQTFGVGKPTIREALSVLASSGILEIRHGYGIVLKRPPLEIGNILVQLNTVDTEKLLHWIEFRRGIEGEAASLAAQRRTPEELKAIEEAHEQVKEEISRGTPTAESDYRFHRSIALATHNPIIINAVTTFSQVFHQHFELSIRHSKYLPWHRELTIEEHGKIVKAIQHKHPREARSAMLEHLNNVEKRIRLRQTLSTDMSAHRNLSFPQDTD